MGKADQIIHNMESMETSSDNIMETDQEYVLTYYWD